MTPDTPSDETSRSPVILSVPPRPAQGWLRAVRDGKGVSQREAAEKAGVTQQAYQQFETGEVRATITLERLQRAAEALGYEVVYFLRPLPASAPRLTKSRSKATVAPAQDEELPLNLL